VEASIDSLEPEPTDKGVLGCVGSRFRLKTAGRQGMVIVLGIITDQEFAKTLVGSPYKAPGFLS
jgi:hypothetical protein